MGEKGGGGKPGQADRGWGTRTGGVKSEEYRVDEWG